MQRSHSPPLFPPKLPFFKGGILPCQHWICQSQDVSYECRRLFLAFICCCRTSETCGPWMFSRQRPCSSTGDRWSLISWPCVVEGGQGFHCILVVGLKSPRLTIARTITMWGICNYLGNEPSILRVPCGQVPTGQIAAEELLELLQRRQRWQKALGLDSPLTQGCNCSL